MLERFWKNIINKIDPSTKFKFSDHLKKVRLKYANAYKPWSKENDNRLRKMYLNGISKSEISKYFGRGPGSILARLKRLGLIEDQDESDLIFRKNAPHIFGKYHSFHLSWFSFKLYLI